ncbi:SurA N-terminal domain-containing protein [Thiolapillus sp.]
MLLAIRERAQGWFAWLIVGFITIPFALWGIQSYLGVSSDPVAISVDGNEITQREVEQQVRQFRDRLREQLGKSYRPELFDDQLLRQQVIEQMINDRVLAEAAEDWNLRISDDFVRQYIQSIPYFQSNGKFNVQAYNTAVRNQGMTQRSFEESVRQDLVMQQMRNGIAASAIATDFELNETVRLRDQEREVSYLTISGEKLAGDFQPSVEEAKNYYEEHAQAYMVPERVKVEYILLSPAVVGAGLEVTDEKLRAYYEQHKDEFHAPEERRVRHILIQVAENADDAAVEAAKAKIEDIARRLENGESFEALAKEFSDDPGSRDQGGDVGWISPGLMAKAFEEEAYSLEKGKVGKPVRTPFGFHLLEVTEIKSGGEGSFEALYDEIETAYRQNEAEQLLFDQAEQLADLSYETPDSLAPAADVLQLEPQLSDWFDRRGGKGVLASPKVVAAAFSEDVLLENHNSELIELEDDQVLVLRVVEHEAEHPQAFDEVKEEIIATMKREKASGLARAKGEESLQAVQSGAITLPQLAREQDWKLEESVKIKRNSTILPAAIRDTAFAQARPESGKPSVGGVALENGDYVLLVVNKVLDGDPSKLEDAVRKVMREQMNRAKGDAQFNLMGRYLREHADVEIATDIEATAAGY